MSIILDAFGVTSGLVSIHSWLASSKSRKDIEKNFQKLNSGIYVLSKNVNEVERKLNRIESSLDALLPFVRSVQDAIGEYVGLVFPMPIDPDRSKLFQEVLFKYIPQKVISLNENQNMLGRSEYKIQQGHVPMIWTPAENGIPQLGIVPSDFLKDYFGIEILYNYNKKQVNLQKHGMRDSSQSVLISSKSQELINLSNPTAHSEPGFFRKLFNISRPSVEELHFPTGKHRNYAPLHDDIGCAYDVKVTSKLQKERKASGYRAKCSACMDERFVLVRYGLRDYRVPCKRCNANYDNTWQVFPNAQLSE